MTWTYDAEVLTDDTDEDYRMTEVRFLVGDTDETIPLVQDEEIGMVLNQYPPTDDKPAWLAAAHVCDAIAGKFARKMQQTLGPLSASNQQQYEHYLQLAQQMRVLHATNGKGVVSGMSGVVAAAPVLGGGGRTYLGGTPYSNRTDGTGV